LKRKKNNLITGNRAEHYWAIQSNICKMAFWNSGMDLEVSSPGRESQMNGLTNPDSTNIMPSNEPFLE
jgi:hypothetical protein